MGDVTSSYGVVRWLGKLKVGEPFFMVADPFRDHSQFINFYDILSGRLLLASSFIFFS